MTPTDLILMAREAMPEMAPHITNDELGRFADLIVAAEREACAKVCDALERQKFETLVTGGKMTGFGARDCAVVIRARGRE